MSPLPDRVFDTTIINETPVGIFAPAKLNLTKAYIYHQQLKFVLDHELEGALKSEGVFQGGGRPGCETCNAILQEQCQIL